MEQDWLCRTGMLLREEELLKLNNFRVAVLGLGGVGGAAVEGLCRAGIGQLLLWDHDEISISNLNRQLLATRDTVGLQKCEVAGARVLSINPNCKVKMVPLFYQENTHNALLNYHPDFVIDAMDTVSAKLDLAVLCRDHNIPSILCLGTGNRLDPTQFQIGDIAQTKGCGCGLARVMRKELKARGVPAQTVVYSTELPKKDTMCENGRHSPGSISYCPPVAGYYLASYAIRLCLDREIFAANCP